MRTYVPIAVMILLLAAISSFGAADNTAGNLRGVYLSAGPTDSPPPVGRLAVSLLNKSSISFPVNLHYRFHSGDEFQFTVSSNKDGWLYLLHRSPSGKLQQLWPPQNKVISKNINQVRRGQEINIPPYPGKFIFDEEVGNEYFYVVIRSEHRPPKFSVIEESPKSDVRSSAEKPAESSSKPSNKIVQISVRSLQKSLIRGVVFDPGLKDNDPNIYFSPHPENDSSDIVFEFQLSHEK